MSCQVVQVLVLVLSLTNSALARRTQNGPGGKVLRTPESEEVKQTVESAEATALLQPQMSTNGTEDWWSPFGSSKEEAVDRQPDTTTTTTTVEMHEFAPGADGHEMPAVQDDAILEVFHAEVPISGLTAMDLMNEYHSGVTFRYPGKDGNPGEIMWTVELWAKEGLSSAVCPGINETCPDCLPTWNSGIVVSFRKGTLAWTGNKLKERSIGQIRGSVFNAYRTFIAKYLRDHPDYQFWDVLPASYTPTSFYRPGTWFRGVFNTVASAGSTRILKAETCDSFSTASIKELYRLDSRLDQANFDVVNPGLLDEKKKKLKQNYQFIFSNQDTPEIADLSNPDTKKEFDRFIGKLRNVCSMTVTVSGVYESMKKLLKNEGVAFIKKTGNAYYRVPLKGMMPVDFTYEAMEI